MDIKLELEYALLKVAVGYTAVDKTITTVNGVETKKTFKKKEIKPNKKNQKLWIKNFKNQILTEEKYKGKTDIEIMQIRKKELEEILNK